MARRFGPVRGAGVAVEEGDSQGSIESAALGVTGYTGIMQKGPVSKAFKCKTRQEFNYKAGGYIPESQLPDAAVDFYLEGKGAGELWLNRVTDGTEKTAQVLVMNRRNPRSSTMKVKAGNAGRWAGKKQLLVQQYSSITKTTLTLGSVPAGLKEDELAGAVVTLSAVPGKSYKVLSNDAAGILTFASDVDVVSDVNGSANMLISVSLKNEGAAIAVRFREGTLKPAEEFAVDIYFVEGGISSRIRTFDNLSVDPDAPNYYAREINDHSDADYTIKVEDLHVGSITPDIRPANYAGKSSAVTATVLTVEIHDVVSNAVSGAKAGAKALTLGGSVIEDALTLTCTAAGARASGTLTFSGQPADGETTTVNGKVVTWKTAVTDATAQVAIGADAEASLGNLVAFVNASKDADVDGVVFAEKTSATVATVYACTAGVAGNALTLSSTAVNVVAGAATLAGGVAQTWSLSSQKMPFLTGTVTSGVAFAALNEYSFGFTLVDATKNSAKMFANGDTAQVLAYPLEPNALVDGTLLPKASDFRAKFPIVGNTANQITVKTGSDLTVGATAGDQFRVEYLQELGGGYDGTVGVNDARYIVAYDTGLSALRSLRGKNLGLVKLATPGVTSSAVQKAGVAFAESQNWQYRYEIPENIVDESAAEQYINETIGRNDFAVVTFPTYAYVTNPQGGGLKLTTQVGAIHGAEALVAKNYQGFHKAAAGTDVKLSKVLKLPEGLEDKVLDEESLNPIGINVLKKNKGNFILWGDRSLSIDPAFKFKHHREQLSHYENTFLENYDFIIFAINQSKTQNQLISTFIAFFAPELAKGAVVGDSVQDAIRLKIDDENNTDATRAEGDLYAELQPKLADTVERFIIKINKRGVEEAVS